MNKFVSLFALFLSQVSSAKSVYQFHLETPSGKKISFAEFKGHQLLVVNIATRCGYTDQLDGLEKLYKKYKEKGLMIVGVPSNDFGKQTPEENKEVENFCRLNYGVTFPISKKLTVIGEEKHPLYKYLTSQTGDAEVAWNFTKFLFDKKGKLIKRYASSIGPESKILLQDIEKNL